MFQIVLFLILQSTVCISQEDIISPKNENRSLICLESTKTYISDSSYQLTQQYNKLLKPIVSQSNKSVKLLQIIADNGINFSTFKPYIGIFVFFFIFSFIVVFVQIVIMPFISTFCIFPKKCPMKACRKDNEYTKCQKMWPIITLITLLTIAFSSSIAGLVKGPSLIESLKFASCRGVAFLDDINIGKISQDDQNYWTGIVNIRSIIEQLNKSFQQIVNATKLLDSKQLITKKQLLITNIKKLCVQYGNTSNGYSANAEIYDNAFFYSNQTVFNVNSIFKNKYLCESNQQGKTYLLKIYIQQNVEIILDMIKNVEQKSLQINNTQTSQILINGHQIIKQLQSNISFGVQTFIKTLYYPDQFQYSKIGIIFYFIMSIVLSALSIIALMIILFFQKYKIRNILYFNCCIMFLLLLIGVLLGFLMGGLIPINYFSCQFMNPIVNNATQFQTFFELINLPEIGNKIKFCLSDGNIIDVLDLQLKNKLENFQNLSINVLNFDQILQKKQNNNKTFNQTIKQCNTIIENVKNNILYDINDTNALIQILNIANKQTSISLANCNINNVNNDRFIPSFTSQQTNPISCNNFSQIQCIPTSCNQGCIQYKNINNASLNNRYGSTCSYTKRLNGKYQWYKKKNTTLNVLNNKTNQIQDNLNEFESKFLQFKQSLNQLYTIFKKTQFTKLINQESGIIKGMNCQIITEDIKLFVDAVCVQLYATLIFTWLCLIISMISWTIGFFFFVCVGVRSYKQQNNLLTVRSKQKEKK